MCKTKQNKNHKHDMSVNNLLLWEKWRPKNLDDLILLPRIQNHFKDGVNQNFIFYGHTIHSNML